MEHLAVGAWWILMFLMLFVLIYGIVYLGVRENNEPAVEKPEVVPAGIPPTPQPQKRRSKKRRP